MTSLDICKLFVGLLTPLIVAIAGLYLNKKLSYFDHLQWRNQKLIEKRIDIYDNLMPDFNQLLCYFTFLGNWKEKSPQEIIKLKREVDKKIYLAAPLFCSKFQVACLHLIDCCFKSYTGMGKDAQLRTNYIHRKNALTDWNPLWNELFCDDHVPANEINKAYYEIVNIFSKEIGLNV